MKRFSEYRFGDMLVTWWLDDKEHMGMTLIPADMADRVREHEHALEGLVQIHARGDQLPNGYGNGSTLATTTATDRMKLVSQAREGNAVTTELADETGRTVFHTLRWDEGAEALRVSVRFENRIKSFVFVYWAVFGSLAISSLRRSRTPPTRATPMMSVTIPG